MTKLIQHILENFKFQGRNINNRKEEKERIEKIKTEQAKKELEEVLKIAKAMSFSLKFDANYWISFSQGFNLYELKYLDFDDKSFTIYTNFDKSIYYIVAYYGHWQSKIFSNNKEVIEKAKEIVDDYNRGLMSLLDGEDDIITEDFSFQSRNIKGREEEKKKADEKKIERMKENCKMNLKEFKVINDKFNSLPFHIPFSDKENKKIISIPSKIALFNLSKDSRKTFYNSEMILPEYRNSAEEENFFRKELDLPDSKISFYTGLIIEYYENDDFIYRFSSDYYRYFSNRIGCKTKEAYSKAIEIFNNNLVTYFINNKWVKFNSSLKEDFKFQSRNLKGREEQKRKEEEAKLQKEKVKIEAKYGIAEKYSIQIGKFKKNIEGYKFDYNADFNQLSSITFNNLELLSKKLKITWSEIYKIPIIRINRYSSMSILILGKDIKGNLFMYDRRETSHPQAGQTYLYSEYASVRATDIFEYLRNKEIKLAKQLLKII